MMTKLAACCPYDNLQCHQWWQSWHHVVLMTTSSATNDDKVGIMTAAIVNSQFSVTEKNFLKAKIRNKLNICFNYQDIFLYVMQLKWEIKEVSHPCSNRLLFTDWTNISFAHTETNLGLCAACWACFMCHHELWPTSVSHPFSFLNSSLGLAGEKHYQKITIPILRPVLQNFPIPGYFPYILFYCYLFSLLSSGWFVIAVCGPISVRELVKS